MLDEQRVAEAILTNLLGPSVPAEADKLAAKIGLPPGSVVFGPKAIEITEGGKIHYVQIMPNAQGVIIQDEPFK